MSPATCCEYMVLVVLEGGLGAGEGEGAASHVLP